MHAAPAKSRRYSLKPTRATLHGHFSRDLAPVLTIDAGDTVDFECLDAWWGMEPHSGVTHIRREFEPRDPKLDSGHALTGPVFIRGAKPGMTLAIGINALRPGGWAATYAGGWPCAWNERLGVTNAGVFHVYAFDHAKQTATNQHGHTVKIRPFMGVMGMAPAESGIHSTTPPRAVGGNMDCKELVAGSTLYLPIEVEGGLFSVGDGHAAQGDGEVSVMAIECPMDATLTFNLIDGAPLRTPYAKTRDAWVTLGFHTDLNEAMVLALEAMLTLMQHLMGITRLDALALASVVVDFRITQVVNTVRGVHAVLRHDAVTKAIG
jgi:acetamidase/formamidase